MRWLGRLAGNIIYGPCLTRKEFCQAYRGYMSDSRRKREIDSHLPDPPVGDEMTRFLNEEVNRLGFDMLDMAETSRTRKKEVVDS